MKPSLDCIPCYIEQAINAARRFSTDLCLQRQIVRQTIESILSYDDHQPSPKMGAQIDRITAALIGVDDLYFEQKHAANRAALVHRPMLVELVRHHPNPFEAAVRLAIAGNIMDFTSPGGRPDADLPALCAEALVKPLAAIGGENPIAELKAAAMSASRILYLSDNAGEVVMDYLLIDQLPKGRVTVVVRDGPIANDALLEDAVTAGLDTLAPIITSGIAMPGTLLAECPPAFQSRFAAADLVISKGQGNFETLDFEPGRIFFLFIAKCKAVARYLGIEIGDFVCCDRR